MKVSDFMTVFSSLAAICVYIFVEPCSAAELQRNRDLNEKHGYWWYEERPEPAKPGERADLPPPPAEADLNRLHPDDMAKLIEEYRKYAIWKPTPEHVAWHWQLVDHARRKSVAFMNVTQYVMDRRADLNMQSAYPTSAPGQNARVTARDEALKSRLQQGRDSAALVFLTQPGCEYCDAQRGVLKLFQHEYGWNVTEIDITREPQKAARFGLEYTPMTVVIFKGSADWMPVAVGVESLPNLAEGVYRALRLNSGEITPQQYTLREFEDGGVYDPARALQ